MSIFSQMNSIAICLVGPDHLLVLLIYDDLKIFETFSHLLEAGDLDFIFQSIFKKFETISR